MNWLWLASPFKSVGPAQQFGEFHGNNMSTAGERR
jgi:hypothetical protein